MTVEVILSRWWRKIPVLLDAVTSSSLPVWQGEFLFESSYGKGDDGDGPIRSGIGRGIGVGVWTEMVEDDHGLRMKGKLAMDTTRGKEAYALLKMRALNGLPIGFVSKQWAYDRDTDVRTLTEVDLWEVSPGHLPGQREGSGDEHQGRPRRVGGPQRRRTDPA